MRAVVAVAVLLASQGILSAQKAAPEKVSVYVTSVGARDGFTDPIKENVDTVKDLREELGDKKAFRLVDNPDEAQISLVVLGRATADMTAGLFGYPARDRTIRVKFTCCGMETEMTASAQGGSLASGGAWGKAAKKLAKQIDEWVDANRARIGANGRATTAGARD